MEDVKKGVEKTKDGLVKGTDELVKGTDDLVKKAINSDGWMLEASNTIVYTLGSLFFVFVLYF